MRSTGIAVAAVTLLVAMLAAPIAESKKNPRLHSFNGVCEFSGQHSNESNGWYGGNSERSLMYGTCRGSANGGGPIGRRARLVTELDTPWIGVRGTGSGYIVINGMRGRINFHLERTADRVADLRGGRGSKARAVVHKRSSSRQSLALTTDGKFRSR